MSESGFPLWFQVGCYGGLACCLLAIAINITLIFLGHYHRVRRATWSIIASILAAILLLPALIWFYVRFVPFEAHLPALELALMLVYVVCCGWVVPLGSTLSHLFVSSSSSFEEEIPLATSAPQPLRAAAQIQPPHYPPGIQTPFVFSEETPWGWLEYRSGKFQGQRLGLKRAVATIGRDGNCDIWIDDDLASRHHAELAWDKGQICLTDCDSLNGTLVNGKRVRGTILLSSNDLIEIGEHRFLFSLAERKESNDDDPLARHIWRSSLDLQTGVSRVLPVSNLLLEGSTHTEQHWHVTPPAAHLGEQQPPINTPEPMHPIHIPLPVPFEKDDTRQTPPPIPVSTRALRVLNGPQAGSKLVLGRKEITVGQMGEADWPFPGSTLAPVHARLICKPEGDYIEDLTEDQGTQVNDMPLWCPQLLKPGDIVCLGDIRMEYLFVPASPVTPLPAIFSEEAAPSSSTATRTVPTSAPVPTVPRPLKGPPRLTLPSKHISIPTDM